jgi:hypothetical protein
MKKITIAIALLFCCSLVSAQNKDTDDDNDYFIYGSVAVALIVIGVLVYRFFKNTAEKKGDLVPVIKGVFPNPSHGPITIQIEGKASQLKVLNMSGQSLGSFAIIGSGEVQFDLSSSPRGNYMVVAYYGATQSNAVQFTLQ